MFSWRYRCHDLIVLNIGDCFIFFRYDSYRVARRLPFIFICTWIFCILALLFIPYSTVIKYNRCLLGYKMIGTWLWDFYTPYTLVLAVAIPLSTMIYCYIKMFVVLNESKKRFHSSAIDDGNVSSSDRKIRHAQINIFQTCLIMVILFLVSWMSSKSALFLYSIGFYKTLSGNHYTLGNLAVTANSCVNPYVYALRYDDFKYQLMYIFKARRKVKNVHSVTSINIRLSGSSKYTKNWHLRRN